VKWFLRHRDAISKSCLSVHICRLNLLPTAITLSVSQPSEPVSATEGDEHTVLQTKNTTGNETIHRQINCIHSKHNIFWLSRCPHYD